MTKSTFARNHHWKNHGPYCRHEPHHARHQQRSAPNNAYFDARGFRTFKDLIRGADQHGLDHNSLSASALAAVWSRIPQVWDTARDIQPREQKEFEWRLTRFVQHTYKMISDRARDFRPQDISAAVLGIAKVVKELRSGRGARLETIFRELLDATNSRVEHNLFQHFAFASAQHLPGFEARNVSNLSRFDAQGISNLAYAYALVKHSPALEDGSNLFDLLTRQSVHLFGKFKPQGFSNLVWAFATVKVSNPELFAKVADAVVARDLKTFNAQDLANIVWAYATAEVKHPRLFRKVADVVVARELKTFKPQGLANIVWAYATAGVNHPDLFHKVADNIVARDLKSFKPQNLANIVWAYATAEVERTDLFPKVAGEVVARDLKSFKPQELANIVWAFATAKVKHHDLFHKVADDLVGRDLNSFNAQGLANIVWVYATAEVKHHDLFREVADAVVARELKTFKPQGLANIVWAYATAAVSHPRLFEKVANEVIGRDLKSFKPQNLANIVWAYATAAVSHPRLFEKVANEVIGRDLKSCNSQDLANIAWAFAVSNVDAPDLFSERFVAALIQKSETFNAEQLRQLHQWKLWRVEMNARVPLPQDLPDRCRAAFTSSSIYVSVLQKEVVCELSAMGLQSKEEVLLPSGYHLDVLVQVDGQNVGIEVDGPSHFIKRKPTGKTMLKQRQIVSIDRVRIVSVPFWEWDGFGDDRGAKRRYLRSKLET